MGKQQADDSDTVWVGLFTITRDMRTLAGAAPKRLEVLGLPAGATLDRGAATGDGAAWRLEASDTGALQMTLSAPTEQIDLTVKSIFHGPEAGLHSTVYSALSVPVSSLFVFDPPRPRRRDPDLSTMLIEATDDELSSPKFMIELMDLNYAD